MQPSRHRIGLTLIEIVIVLIVMSALAALVVPLLGDISIGTAQGRKSPEQVATEHSLNQLREAIMGSPSKPGVWSDVGQRPEFFPREISDLFQELPPVYMATLGSFNPTTRIGWRGPYLINASGRDALGRPSILDGWGSEILIQIDFDGSGQVANGEARYVRLVSAGENGIFETPLSTNDMVPGSDPASQLTLAECGDDIVLFLRVADTRR